MDFRRFFQRVKSLYHPHRAGFYGGVLLLILACWFIAKYWHRAPTQVGPPPSTVTTIVVSAQPWQTKLTALGNVKASQSINLSSEVPGLVAHILFDSGQTVQQGQTLVNLHADNWRAAVNKAKAKLEFDNTQFQKKKSLLPKHYIGALEVDATLGQVREDEASLQQAEAELAQRTIIAPFSGIVGILKISVGEYIQAGETIVNLEALTPVFVDFRVPEKWVQQIKAGMPIELIADAVPNHKLTGVIKAIDWRIDDASRSLMVRAEVPNRDLALLSGMSAVVSIPSDKQQEIIIPQTALSFDPSGSFVFVIDKNNLAHRRAVSSGARDDNNVVIKQGLASGEVVVIAGQQKLQDGMPVVINNTLAAPGAK